MRTTTLRSTAVAAVVAPLLALSLTACSGGDDGGDGGSSGSSGGSAGADGSSGGGDDGGAGSDGKGGKTLTTQQLKAALLKTGDVQGYRVQRSKGDNPFGDEKVQVDKEQCQPIIDMFEAKPKHERAAAASAVLGKAQAGVGAGMQQLLLYSYSASDDAKSVLSDLRSAVDECDEFTGSAPGSKGRKVTVEDGGSVDVGAESVQFRIVPKSGSQGTISVTVVRSGAATASFVGMALEGKKAQPTAKPVVVKQEQKLASAQK